MTTIRFSRLLVLALALPLFSGCQSDDSGTIVPPPPKRTLNVSVLGSGAVTSLPSGINCTQGGTGCSAQYDDGSLVVLAAQPGANADFGAWAGCTPSGTNPRQCSLTMNGDKAVSATFVPISSGGVGDMFMLTKVANAADTAAHLISFNRAAPGTVLFDGLISGLEAGDAVVAMDFRSSNGQLYAVARASGGSGSLYVIDKGTAVATRVALLTPNTIALPSPAAAGFDMAFEPGEFDADGVIGPEFIRLFADLGGGAGKVFTINPDDGSATESDVEQGATASGVGFTNAFRGTRATTTYVINAQSNTLNTVTLPGDLTLVGALTVDAPAANGLVVDGRNGSAFAAFTVGTAPTLYDANLTTGALSNPRQIGAVANPGFLVAGLAIAQPLEPKVFGIATHAASQGITNPDFIAGLTLYSFNASTPGTVTRIGDVSGPLANDETIVALDVRPSNNQLYGLSSAGKLYVINPINAVASAGVTVADLANPFTLITGFDFNPSGSTLRIIGGEADADGPNINLTVNPDNGATITTHDAIAQLPFEITSVAFDNNNAQPPQARTWYGLDVLSDRLFRIDPNTGGPGQTPGRLTHQANLSFDATAVSGFEIVAANTAYVTRASGPTSSVLLTLSLATGAGTQVGNAIGSASGFIGQVVGLTAPIGGGNLFTASTGTTPSLLAFDPTTPASLVLNSPIAGLAVDEEIVAMDFRFQNNSSTLYALVRKDTGGANTARLYTISTSLPVTATPVAITGNVTTPGAPPANYPLSATAAYGMDVDPQNGSIRVASNRAAADGGPENLSINPTTGVATVVAEDLNQTPTPAINAAAHSRNFAGSGISTLYLINAGAANNQLMTVNDGTGELTAVGATGMGNGASDEVSFDAAGGHDGLALATEVTCPDSDPFCLDPDTSSFSTLYQIDLATGAGTSIGTVGSAPEPANAGEDSRIRFGAMTVRFPQ